MRVYRNNELLGLTLHDGKWYARIKLGERHDPSDTDAGHIAVTSAVQSIDFKLGTILTQNSLYILKGGELCSRKL